MKKTQNIQNASNLKIIGFIHNVPHTYELKEKLP